MTSKSHGEGQGEPHTTAGRGLCGSGQRSNRDWQGLGFISHSTIQVINLLEYIPEC